MKVPPKRKGNPSNGRPTGRHNSTLNESPSEKEGKFGGTNEPLGLKGPSMKVPPKRKGNLESEGMRERLPASLNESPSEKEGKFFGLPAGGGVSGLPQ